MSWGMVATVGGSLLSGYMGGKGKSESKTETKTMDPAMRPYIFGGEGQTGLVPSSYALFQQKTAPGGQPGFDMMKQRGMQMMGGSMAGNPFSQGYQGGSNFGNAGNTIPAMQSAAPAPAPAPAQQQMTVEQIIAEIERRKQAEQMLAASGWSPEMIQQYLGTSGDGTGGIGVGVADSPGNVGHGGGGSAM